MSHETKPPARAPAPGSPVVYPADHPTGADRYRIAEPGVGVLSHGGDVGFRVGAARH